MNTKTLLDNTTYRLIDICENTKDGHYRYVKVYLLIEEIYNLAKAKHNQSLELTGESRAISDRPEHSIGRAP